MSFLTTAPLWLSGLVLVLLPTLLSMAGPFLVRRVMSLESLSTNNEVAGFKFAVVGVLYAVLLAFAVIVVWERFSESEGMVASEAGAAATIFRLASGVDDGDGADVRVHLRAYLGAAIAEDWPAMEHGTDSPSVTGALDALYGAVLKFSSSSPQGGAVVAELLHQLDLLTQARRSRLAAASGFVPSILWLALIVDGVLTIGFTLFFGNENLRAQSMMTGILALLIFSGLLVIVAIDHPFAGSVRVGPEALSEVLEDFAR